MKTQKFQEVGENRGFPGMFGQKARSESQTYFRPKNNSITFKYEIKTEICKNGFKGRKKNKKISDHSAMYMRANKTGRLIRAGPLNLG